MENKGVARFFFDPKSLSKEAYELIELCDNSMRVYRDNEPYRVHYGDLRELDNSQLEEYKLHKMPLENKSFELEKEYPQLFAEFKKLQEEQYDLFVRKMCSYGIGNIAMGSNLDTPEDIKLSITSVWIRCWDKMNRLKNLVVLSKPNTIHDESIQDTWKDLSNYGIIAQLVSKGMWKK